MDSSAVFKMYPDFKCFPIILDAITEPEFIYQFKSLVDSKPAKQVKCIVYLWSTDKQIPRIRKGSDILYIGQTQKTFKSRHGHFAGKDTSRLNWSKYSFIRSQYGPIKMFYLHSLKSKATECLFLERYFEDHLEYPSLNRNGK